MTAFVNTAAQLRVGADRACSVSLRRSDDNPGGVEMTTTAGRSIVGVDLDRDDVAAVHAWLGDVLAATATAVAPPTSTPGSLAAQVRDARAALDAAAAAARPGNHLGNGWHVREAGVCEDATGCQLYRGWVAAKEEFERASAQLIDHARHTRLEEGVS